MQIPWIIQGACFPSIFLLSRSFVRDPRSEKPMAVMPRLLAFLCLGDEAENSGVPPLKRSQGFRKTRETIGVSFLGFMRFTLDLWDETNISPENQRLVQMTCPFGFRPICRGEMLVLGRFFFGAEILSSKFCLGHFFNMLFVVVGKSVYLFFKSCLYHGGVHKTMPERNL